MILDWNSYCYKVHTTRRLKREDPSDNKSVISQEAHYIKYLMRKHKTYAEIYLFWKKIKNGTAAVFKDDPVQQVSMFAKIFHASLKITDRAFDAHYSGVKIYKSEIRFLNNVKAPVWVKEYWMAMLIYWKFASQHTKNVEINRTLCNWAMRQTSVKDKRYGLYQDKIARYNCLDDGHVMQTGIFRKNSRKYWFDWSIEKSDEEFVEIKNLDNIKKTLKLLNGIELQCPNCGKYFMATSYQHTDLCPDCYKIKRRQYKTQKDIERYHIKKSDAIEKKD